MEDGLSHNSVWAVIQDKRGFMWFGTNDGLNRFDGKTFKVYKHIPGDSLSIGSNFIHTIKETSKGHFLTGTKQGLYLYNQNNESFKHLCLAEKEKNDVAVNNIMEDSNGNVWIACHGQGLYVLSPDLKVKKHYMAGDGQGLPSNFIWTIIQDSNGIIWIGSDGAGLINFYPEEEKFTLISGDEKITIKDKTIYSLYCDVDNKLWIGTATNGLYCYDYRFGKVARYLNKPNEILKIKAITEFSEHALLMGSDKGLIVFDLNSGTYHFANDNLSYNNISDKSIFAITKDNEGAFWIATYFSGVNYYSPAINQFSYYSGNNEKSFLKRNIISGFAEDKSGHIWVGTKDDGLSRFNPQNGSFEKIQKSTLYHDIQCLMLDNHDLWLAPYSQGISVLNTQTGKFVNYRHKEGDPKSLMNPFVNDIIKTAEGDIVVATSEGVNIFNPKEKNFNKIEALEGVSIKDIEEDGKGNLWFASHLQGIYRLLPDGKIDNYLVGNNINCIHHDAKRRIWIGTEGGGLSLFNVEKQSVEFIFDDTSGLPSNIIYAILDDIDGTIWVSTGGGLAKINPETQTIRTFGYIESLQKIGYNNNCALHTSGNRFYFGGTNGFVIFNPRDITDNLNIPPVVITGFQIFNKEIKLTEKDVKLKHNQSTFSFDFVALSYLSPTHNQYAYILEGFDKEWNYAGNSNKALYMNIPPGKYIFRVKASNNDGVWNETGASITITVNRPFWFSNLMIIIYILLIAALLTYTVKTYKRRLKKKNEEDLYKYKVKKEKEIYESKINFFTNIAHEIRTPLSLIVAPLETAMDLSKKQPQINENLEIIESNTKRLLDLVNQLLDFRKIEEDMFKFNFRTQNVINIVKQVYDQYLQYAKSKGITIELNLENDEIKCKIDSESVYKILGNLVSNAIKYAKSGIVIDVKTDSNHLQVRVIDDGIGIKPEYVNKIFEPFYQIDNNENIVNNGSGIGLSLSRSLAVKHGGEIMVEQREKDGVTFLLQIPVITDDAVQAGTLPPLSLQTVPENQNQMILIVEDNEELRKFISNNLKENFMTIEAENGVQALKIIEEENINVIVSDILMPEMDGIELVRNVKTNPAYSYIPVILLSAKVGVDSKIEGLELGADVYMEKPFSMTQLKAQINSIIENRNKIRDRFLNSPLQYYKENREKDNSDAEFIKKLNTAILNRITDENISVEDLSEEFAMGRSNLYKKVKGITGLAPNEYVRLIRLNKAVQLLSTKKYKVSEVCYMVGFNTPSYFSKCFLEQFGKLPKDYVQEK
jgi:signal transduction histidine kinase/ligand-binding sensor domain-containing protein/DNA-binding response OmpR family regulator